MAQLPLPSYSKESELGELGMRLVEEAVHGMGWIFRPKRKADVGIDGEIEVVGDNSQASSRLISVQVKCGESFLRRRTRTSSLTYRGSMMHLRYWLDHSLPVIVVVCDPKSKACYWAEVSSASVVRNKESWTVALSHRLTNESKYDLGELAKRSLLDNFLPLALYKWLHEKYFSRIYIRSDAEFPRDYPRYPYIAVIDKEITMVDYIYDRYGRFDVEELRESLRFKPINEQNCGGKILLCCLITQNRQSFEFDVDFKREMANAKGVRFLHFLLETKPLFGLKELSRDGVPIFAYEAGQPTDGWGDLVPNVPL